MPGVLKIVLVILFLLILIRKKWDLGLVLFLGTALTALLFRMPLMAFGREVWAAAKRWETLSLVGIFWLVIYLGRFLQEKGHFRVMVDSLEHLVPEARLILALPPAVIGLLPMFAGAMMSAPIIEEAGRRWKLTPAWKTFFNYWFRHIWEYSWPLYANLIIAAAITGIPIGRISLHQFPFTVLAATLGVIILMKNVAPVDKERSEGKTLTVLVRLLSSLWPILLAILLIFILRLSMILSLGIAALATQATSRMSLKERGQLLLKSLDVKAGLLIVSVMVFKNIMEASGALASVTRAFPPQGAGAYALLFAAPFLMGFLTGVNQAFVGISFPMLMPIFGQGRPDIVLVMFAYVSGFVGILLSPAHLCLVTTVEYFRAELKDVYKIMIVPSAIIFGAAFLILLVFRIL
jgi:integral membrane protein (TIGR00529 family)